MVPSPCAAVCLLYPPEAPSQPTPSPPSPTSPATVGSPGFVRQIRLSLLAFGQLPPSFNVNVNLNPHSFPDL